MKSKDLKIKMTCDTRAFNDKLEEVKKSIEELNNTKIIVNIETRTNDTRWHQFWRAIEGFFPHLN